MPDTSVAGEPFDSKKIKKLAETYLVDYKNYEIRSMLHVQGTDIWTVEAIVGNLTIVLTIDNITGELLVKNESRKYEVNISEAHIDVSDSLTAQIQVHLGKDQEILYEELAKIENSQYMMKTAKAIDFKEKGREIFERFSEKLYQKLCIDYDFCKKKEQFKDLDTVGQAGLIAQILFQYVGTIVPLWVPISMLAVMIVKFGMTKFCKCD